MGFFDSLADSMTSDDPKRDKSKDTSQNPNSIKLLGWVYTFYGIGWIVVAWFGIWKRKKWSLEMCYASIVFWLAIMLVGAALYNVQTDGILGLVTGILIWLLILAPLIITTFYVRQKHRTMFG